MIEKPRSVYQRGAQDGLIMGPLLTVVVLLFGATPFVSWLFLPSIIAIICVPIMAYRMLSKSYAEDYECSTFSALWLHGICIFFFGSAIMAAAAYVAMSWIWPDYMPNLLKMMIDILSQSPDPLAAEQIDLINRNVSEGHFSPSAMIIGLIEMAVLSGSILSMLIALILRSRPGTPTPPPINN